MSWLTEMAIPATWKDCHALAKTRKRVLGYCTRLITENSPTSYTIRHHETDILTFRESGEIVLDTSGYRSMTTKERLNILLENYGYRITQENRLWTIAGHGEKVMFSDGMVIQKNGKLKVTGAKLQVKKLTTIKRKIDKYCKTFIEELYAGKIDKPGAGDCFICQFTGGNHGDNHHLEEHIREKYYVPSLLVRAMKEQEQGLSVAAKATIGKLVYKQGNVPDFFLAAAKDQILKALKKYFYRRFDLAC